MGQITTFVKNMKIKIKKLNDKATLPSRASESDAGYDLYNLLDSTQRVEPGQRLLIKTGISVAIPEGYYGRIAPRSGLAYKHGIDVLAGVIDSGYRGEVGVVIINLGSTPHLFEENSRVAQLIIEKCHSVEWEQCEDLNDSNRGTGGFGSTGE
jgi:dUTP pyrophosphatase